MNPIELAAKELEELRGSLSPPLADVMLLYRGVPTTVTTPWIGSEILDTYVWYSTWDHSHSARLDSRRRTEFYLRFPQTFSKEDAEQVASVYKDLLNLVREEYR